MRTIKQEVLDANYLVNLPSGAKKILDYLLLYTHKTQRELIQELAIPTRTIRYSLRRLKERELIKEVPNLKDFRDNFYKINPDMLEVQS